jgi:hypothetical protein
VKLFVQREVNGVLRHPHEIVDLEDDLGEQLIAAGSAQSLDVAPPAPSPHPEAPPA